MFPLPGPEKSDRAIRDRTPRPKRLVALSVLSQWFLTPARLPLNPQMGVPGSPGPRGPRTATENDWPAPAGQFQLDSLRHGLRSQGGAPREKRTEEVQWLPRERFLTPKNGANAWHSSFHNKIIAIEALRRRRRTTEGKEALQPEPVRMFAPRIACIHLRLAHLRTCLNLQNASP